MWEYAFRGKVGDRVIAQPDRDILIEANKIREDLERYNSRASFDIRNLEDILSLLSFDGAGASAFANQRAVVPDGAAVWLLQFVERGRDHPLSTPSGAESL